LQKWNDISGTRIDIGQELLVYQPKPPIDTSNYITYKVKSGDSLWLIAEKYPKSSVKQIMDLNSINRKLKPGHILIIQEK
jgi:membrane-bound lytic murein transglycosylase D